MIKPFFSIVIPSLNEEINLPILLTSITKQTDQDFEVFVIDSYSTDATPKKAIKFEKKIPRFKFISHKTKNVSAARNYGASKTNGKFLIFLDSDVELTKDFIFEIKNKIQEFNLDMTTVWNRSKTKSLTGKIVLFLLNINMSLFQKIKPSANGPCIVIKKELFEKIGKFDEEIIFGEDFDLVQKAHKQKANFRVFKQPVLYVSTRRFEKEGLWYSLYKSIKAILYQLFFGPIKKPIFDYEMGGQYYKK